MKNIQDCASQPLHRFEKIQSYAVFIRFDAELNIEAFSSNVRELKRSSTQPLATLKSLEEIFEPFTLRKIKSMISSLSSGKLIKLNSKEDGIVLNGYLYPVEQSFHLEIEPPQWAEIARVHKQKTRWTKKFHECVLKISSAESTSDALSAVTQFLGDLVGFDRVMIYEFMEDGHGIVVQESLKKKDWEPYLGLHYPESDIPAQARALYLKNKSRIILDRDAQDIPVIKTTELKADIVDLTDSSARSVAPVHLEYLRNMGVRSSASFSLLREGSLWGLISCHHAKPFYLSYRDRSLIYSLGQILMARLTQIDRRVEVNAANKASQLVLEILSQLSLEQLAEDESQVDHFRSAFAKHSSEILAITEATSFVARINDETIVIGRPLSGPYLAMVDQYLSTRHEFLTSIESLLDIDQSFMPLLSEGAGFLALSSDQPHSKNYLAWIRPKFEHQVRWAGRNEKVLRDEGDKITLHPRVSFSEFIELKKFRTRPWAASDRETALQFTQFFSSVISSFWRQSQGLVSKLQEVDRVKDSFIGMVSHELRTPLNNILGWIQILQNNRGMSEQLRHGLEVIRSNAENQALIVNDLLDFSRIIQGKLQIELCGISLTQLIRDVAESLKPTLSIKSQSIKLILEEDLRIMGDADRIKQVYWNLLHNAIKFSSAHSQIEVVAKDDGSHIYTEIIDQGEGIDRDQLKMVFQKFYQTESGSQRRHKGLGLGLAIVKSIVDHHAGEIAAFSEGLGHGARFVVTFPRAEVALGAPAEMPVVEKSVPTQNSKILLVEDNDDSREFMSMGLEHYGVTVVAFGDAQLALNYLKTDSNFDVIISDIGLPGMDGHQFRLALKADPKTDRIPSIALTAHTTKGDIENALRVGFSTHIAKPVNVEEVISAIENFKKRNKE